MKNINLKIKLLIFLCLVLIILPLKQSWAFSFNIFSWIKDKIAWAFGFITDKAVREIAKIISGFVQGIVWGIHKLFFELLIKGILAKIVDLTASLNPFLDVQYSNEQGKIGTASSPVKIIWSIFTNFAYIILVFSSLFAAYQWLLESDETAKGLIFNIILVSLLINFTFVLVKETFIIVKNIENGLTGGQSSKIGTFIAASLWQKDPIKEVIEASGSSTGDESVIKAIAQVIGYIMIIVFDMVIFIVLLIVAILFIARYLIITFLGGTSSIALATLVFPQAKGALGEFFASMRIWDKWLDSFLRWLLVVPIFVFLVILGSIFKENALGQLGQEGKSSDLIQFVLLLFILAGWYIFSLNVAHKLSKGISNMGKIAGLTLMTAVGGFAARSLLGFSKGAAGNILSRTGNWLTQRVPPTRFGAWISRPAQWAAQTGQAWQQQASQSQADLIKAQMNILTNQLRQAQTPQQYQQIANNIRNIINRNHANRFVMDAITQQLSNLSDREREKLLTDQNSLRTLFANSDQLSQEAQRALIDLYRKANQRTKLRIFENGNLLDIITNAQNGVATSILNEIAEEIENLKPEDLIRSVSRDQTGNTLRIFNQQIQGNTRIGQAINTVTPLYASLINNDVNALTAELVRLGTAAGRYANEIQNAANNLGTSLTTLNQSYENAIRSNDDILIGLAQGPRQYAFIIQQLRGRYANANAAANALSLDQKGRRLLNSIW